MDNNKIVKCNLENMYKRFNRLCEYSCSSVIFSPNTIINILNDYFEQDIDLEEKIKGLERNNGSTLKDELAYANYNLIQPKSIFVRIMLLELITSSIPIESIPSIGFIPKEVLDISVAIALHYAALEVYKFSDNKISETEKKYVINRDDFWLDYNAILAIRGTTSEQNFRRYIELFSDNILEPKDYNNSALYEKNDKIFILNIPDFLDYVLLRVENLFLDKASNQERELYRNKKGAYFEKLAFKTFKGFFNECYHTLYYYPNEKQKIEIDILLREGDYIAILECKSGSFSFSNKDEKELIITRISNKTKKAYVELKNVNSYIEGAENYEFKNKEECISGNSSCVVGIQLLMYPMDFISSNLHAEFKEYFEPENPILSISYEHLLAILTYSKIYNIDIWDYWKKRQEYIKRFPRMYFDVNELDLFFELNNMNNSILEEMRQNGFLDHINPNAHIITTFRDSDNNEYRPAGEMIHMLDEVNIYRIIEEGKKRYMLNKRFLENLDSFLNCAED